MTASIGDMVAQHPVFSCLVFPGDGREPVQGRIEAGKAERERLASFLRIEGLDSFSFDYRLEPFSVDRFRLTGKILADLTQLCVVTLDPVSETVEEAVSVECWPEEDMGEQRDGEDSDPAAVSALPEDPPVSIVNGKIDLGAFAMEVLASAINPYPRKDDIAFEWQESKDTVEGASGPFAKLASLKQKS